MAPIVRNEQPPPIENAIYNDANERGGHDHVTHTSFVESFEPPRRVVMLCDETFDDIRRDSARRWLSRRRRRVFPARIRCLGANQELPAQHWNDGHTLPDRRPMRWMQCRIDGPEH